MDNEKKYKELSQSYKKLAQTRETYAKEWSEKKGNLEAYLAEKKEQLKKATELKVDPQNLKQEIENLFKSIQDKLSKNQKLCQELEQMDIG